MIDLPPFPHPNDQILIFFLNVLPNMLCVWHGQNILLEHLTSEMGLNGMGVSLKGYNPSD